MPLSFVPFLFYCFITGITPGPANLCSLAAALKYGREGALRQWRGIFTGFFLDAMGAVFVTFFLGTLLNRYVKVLSYIGAAYILWLAFQMLRNDDDSRGEYGESCTFTRGLLIQLTNVKAIVFCFTALSAYVLPHTRSFRTLFAVGLFLSFTGPICNLAWIFAGVALRRVFADYRLAVNIAMAALLALCAVGLAL